MKDFELKVKELEARHDELESLYDNLHDTSQKQLNENDVRIIFDKLLTEKKLMTETEVEKKLSQSQLQTIKWIVGTGISTIAIIVGVFKIFI